LVAARCIQSNAGYGKVARVGRQMNHLPHLFYIAGSACFIIGTILNW
jgi:hypothetical protein